VAQTGTALARIEDIECSEVRMRGSAAEFDRRRGA
jgi:hypothetical protein